MLPAPDIIECIIIFIFLLKRWENNASPLLLLSSEFLALLS